MDTFLRTFSERGVHGKFFRKISQNFFFREDFRNILLFYYRPYKVPQERHLFLADALLQTSSIFTIDLKKDIFFLLLDPRLSVKEWVGV